MANSQRRPTHQNIGNDSGWFPKWQPYDGHLDHHPVRIHEYLPADKSLLLGLQHAFAMFGATVLAPLLMGFDANLAILMAGLSTVLFFFLTGGRVPSYLGSDKLPKCKTCGHQRT